MMKMKKTFAILLSVVIITSLAACGGASQSGEATNTPEKPSDSGKKIVLKVGTTTVPDGHYVKGLEFLKQKLDEYSNGQIDLQIFPNSQLGNERDLVEGVGLGTVEMALVSTGPLPNFAPNFAVFDLPYIVSDREKAFQVMDGEVGQAILDELSPKGIKGLGFWENGFRHITNSKTEIVKPSDVTGLKIRLMENNVHMETFKQLGANPVAMAWSEVYTALQQKVIDGQENPLAIIETNKLEEIQPYISLTGHFYSPTVLMINKKLWDSFSDDTKAAIEKAQVEARKYQRDYSAEYDQKVIEKFKQNGVSVTEVNIEEWKEAARPVYDKFKDTLNQDYVKALLGE